MAFAVLVAGLGLLGLVVGSFLNVVIYRVPRGESIVAPRSCCPACGTTLRAVRQHSRCVVRGPPGSVSQLQETDIGAVPDCRAVDRGSFCRDGRTFRVRMVAAGIRGPRRRTRRVGDDRPRTAGASETDRLRRFCSRRRAAHSCRGGERRLASIAHRGSACAAVWFGVFFAIHAASPGSLGFGDVRLVFVLGLALGWLGIGYVLVGLFVASLLARSSGSG